MDLGNNIISQIAINPQTVSETYIEGSEIDRVKYEGSVIGCYTGEVYGTPTVTTVTFAVYECATSGGSFTAVTDADAVCTGANRHAEINLDLVPVERYVKVRGTVEFDGGTGPWVLLGAEAIFGGAKNNPV